ncbi:permease [Psychromonas ingrahamii 37]|uniref:Permease n=1 Tax=Psychromonas ingrahamii (strain DSM 17664 / CCUG 51855 / 37) TaxID=357804 RepID=A1T0Q2_PSYIN|nr:permease [Psychromonas ingrahamii]ABM05317.1 permease [Psychromonas ingrahamii 37]
MLLFLSILALFLGPLTYRLLQRQPGWLDLLDAFIFVTISGLVLFHILPELLHSGGLFVLVLMVSGLLAPGWIEKYFHKAAHQAHQTTLFLSILGLVLHASLDGSILLAGQNDRTGWLLAIGVLLHRFPVGITIWWLLRPQYGRVLPLVILCGMSAATLVGAFFGEYSLAQLDGQWMSWLQAFVMGSIMHVVLHRPYLHSAQPGHKKALQENKYSAGIGSIAGLIALAFVLLPHWLGYTVHEHQDEKIPAAVEEKYNQQGWIDLHNADNHELAATDNHGVDEMHNADNHELAAMDNHGVDEIHNADNHELAAMDNHGVDEMHNAENHELAAMDNPVVDEHDNHDLAAIDNHVADQAHDHELAEHQQDNQFNTALTLFNFFNIALYSAPMLLIAYFLSALMHYFKPALSLTIPEQESSSFFKDALKGLIYGLPLPICSPSASKMHQQLLGLGANQTFATAFLIAAPIIGFDALLISLPLLGTQMLILRVVLAALFALLIAWLIGRHFKTVKSPVVAATPQCGVARSRFIDAIKDGYQQQLDHTAPWVLLGWALAATLSAASAWTFFDQALWLQILVMIIVAFPFALCATGITPVIAILLLSGLSPGAAMAFLLIAPTISLELLKQVKLQQGFFAALSLAMLTLAGAFLIGLGVNQYIDVVSLPWLKQYQGDYSWWQYGSLVIILVLYLTSLLRRGARLFIAELVPKSLLKQHHHHH